MHAIQIHRLLPLLIFAHAALSGAAEPLSGHWTARAPLPSARAEVAAAALAGKIYVIGGLARYGERVEEYDAAQVKWPKVKGRDALQHLLDEHNLAAADLSRILGGSRNLGAMILRGDRNLTVAHIRKLAAHFKLGAEVFL